MSTMMTVFGSGPARLAQLSAEQFNEKTAENPLHAIWAYPFNAVVTILAIATQPILAVIATIATAVFKLIGCCSQEAREKADTVLEAIVKGCRARPQLFVNIFNPNFKIERNVFYLQLEIDSAAYLPMLPANLAAVTGAWCANFIEDSGWHGLWAYPLNGIVTLLAVTLQPLASVIGIVAAAIFWQLGCCSDTFDKLARTTFEGAITGLAARPELIVGIFAPSFSAAS